MICVLFHALNLNNFNKDKEYITLEYIHLRDVKSLK